ncbi:MAG: NAD-dependent epimerase/dehydratase family protein [Pseudomonadota bacterium]
MGSKRAKKVVVTGIGGRLGRLVARRLHRMGTYEVIGIDSHPVQGLPKDIVHLEVDLRSKQARDVFRRGGIAAVIHTGLKRNPRGNAEVHHQWNVLATARLLDYCHDFNIRKVVVLSSADVYGPRPGNQQYLAEDAPLMGAVDFADIRDLVEVDMQACTFFWRTRGKLLETVILRPVHILGLVRNAASNYLRLSRVPVAMGFDPMVQVIHEKDVVEAIVLALQPGIHGIFNITGPGEVPLSVLLKELGRPTLPVPSRIFEKTLQLMRKLHLTSFPIDQLAHIRYVGMVDGQRAQKVMGFRPKYSLKETVCAVESENELQD